MDYPQIYTTPHGDVTVYAFGYAYWGNTPCYRATVRGEPELWFCKDTEIYQMEEHADGTWTAWYHSTAPELCESRDALVRLGAWK